MRIKRIQRFRDVADRLETDGEHLEAFALRWIACEGLITRAAVKALWLRGASAKDAEAIINKENDYPLAILRRACGQQKHIHHPQLNAIMYQSEVRNLLFHQSVVTSKSKLESTSRNLKMLLDRPLSAFGAVMVKVNDGGVVRTVTIGNPLEELKGSKMKRLPGVRRQSAQGLFLPRSDRLF